jgi:hypothetical protein
MIWEDMKAIEANLPKAPGERNINSKSIATLITQLQRSDILNGREPGMRGEKSAARQRDKVKFRNQ